MGGNAHDNAPSVEALAPIRDESSLSSVHTDVINYQEGKGTFERVSHNPPINELIDQLTELYEASACFNTEFALCGPVSDSSFSYPYIASGSTHHSKKTQDELVSDLKELDAAKDKLASLRRQLLQERSYLQRQVEIQQRDARTMELSFANKKDILGEINDSIEIESQRAFDAGSRVLILKSDRDSMVSDTLLLKQEKQSQMMLYSAYLLSNNLYKKTFNRQTKYLHDIKWELRKFMKKYAFMTEVISGQYTRIWTVHGCVVENAAESSIMNGRYSALIARLDGMGIKALLANSRVAIASEDLELVDREIERARVELLVLDKTLKDESNVYNNLMNDYFLANSLKVEKDCLESSIEGLQANVKELSMEEESLRLSALIVDQPETKKLVKVSESDISLKPLNDLASISQSEKTRFVEALDRKLDLQEEIATMGVKLCVSTKNRHRGVISDTVSSTRRVHSSGFLNCKHTQVALAELHFYEYQVAQLENRVSRLRLDTLALENMRS